jgi:membrane glycosyltransferase
MYHYSLWVTVPFLVAYFGLGYLGMTYFWATVFGIYAALWDHKDKYNPELRAKPLDDSIRIAVLFPIYHEDARRVGGAAGAMWEDLKNHPEAGHFDFFLLSDSRKADNIVQEQQVIYWLQSRYPDARFYYRHRGANVYAKQGNVSDFLRRWGNDYQYMLMLDADSIVPADSMVRMARTLEGNPMIAIVQANLIMVFRKTLYARISRYISSLTLKLGLYGQYFTHLGNGFYYGHNAMIRVEAFIQHCGLPALKSKGPFQAGKPLSHDYVEASLLAGAGYEVWTLPSIDSFEELPTNFIDDMQREMRWMVGSMMYLRVFLTRRIPSIYKTRLFTSAVNYFSPVLGWVFFVLALFGLRYVFAHPLASRYIIQNYTYVFIFSLGFLVVSILVRFLLPTLYYYKKKQLNQFGGFVKSSFTYILYTAYGLLMGPVLMAQLTKMVIYWWRGKKIHWGEQYRDDREISLKEAWNHFGWMTGLGIVFFFLVVHWVFVLDTQRVQDILGVPKWGLLLWYVPLLGGLTFAPLIAHFFSKRHPLVESIRWFESPTDKKPPFVLDRTLILEQEIADDIPEHWSFWDAIESPLFFHFHRKVIESRSHKFGFWFPRLKDKPTNQWSEREKRVVLQEKALFFHFHEEAIYGGPMSQGN